MFFATRKSDLLLNQFKNYIYSQGIIPSQSDCVYSNDNPLQWQNGKYRFTNNLSFVISRDILYSTTCKYLEKVTFNAKGSNFAITIGYNPVSNSNITIDKSNYLISTYLSNLGYDGYYLLNMYPDITSTKIRKSESVLGNYIEIVLGFLNSYAYINTSDVFIFWGSSAYLSINVINEIISLQHGCRTLYTLGRDRTHHQHPGRGVSVNTIRHYNANIAPLLNGSHYLR